MRKLFLLTAAIIAAAATAGRADIIQNGLIGYWAADGNANDSSSTHNNGTFTGNYVPGITGSAFDLSTGYVTMPDVPAYSLTGDYTVDIWFNANGTGGGSFVGQDDGSGGFAKWILGYGGFTTGFYFHLNGSGGSAVVASDPIALPTGWNNLALVKNGTTYSFYLNGTSIGSGSTGGVSFSDPTADLIFGFTETTVPVYHGYIDDVTIYNRALSDTEIGTLATVPEPTGALTGLVMLALMGANTKTRRRRI